MKIIVSKMGAARSQLLEAIRMFFEQRDPISIHTLVGAALEILHDHFDDVEIVWDAKLFFHYDTIYIKDAHRREFKAKINEARNFFKHAARDLNEGKTTIEFETATTDFRIIESIRCLAILEKENFVNSPEFRMFIVWYAKKYPTQIKDEERQRFDKVALDPKII
jgi:hypothetical protein